MLKRLSPVGLVIYFAIFSLFFAAIILGFLNVNSASINKSSVSNIVTTQPKSSPASPTTKPVSINPTSVATPVPTAVPPTPTSAPATPTIALPEKIVLPTIAPSPTVHFNAPSNPVYRPDPVMDTSPPFKSRFNFKPGDQVIELRPGVIQINRTVYGQNPLRTHIMLFDLTAKEFGLKVAVQNDYLSGVAPTSKIAASHNALVGVNGDLFGGTGLPQGLTILNSQVAVSPKHRATFAWSNSNEPFIGYFTQNWTWDSQITAENGEMHPLQQLNTPCKAEQLCIYNDLYPGLPNTKGDVKVLLDQDNVVVGITQTLKTVIPETDKVLWGLGSTATWLLDNLSIGQKVEINIKTDEPLSDYKYAVSGGPIFLEDGKFKQDCLCNIGDCSKVPPNSLYFGTSCEEFTLDWKLTHYLEVRMPRVGVGFDKDKTTLIVVEVDGYQPGFSVGIRQVDFAKIFTEFGANTAMELDGGGSATMWANGKLVSHPSDGSGSVERWVPDALLFYWNGPATTPTVTPTVTSTVKPRK